MNIFVGVGAMMFTGIILSTSDKVGIGYYLWTESFLMPNSGIEQIF